MIGVGLSPTRVQSASSVPAAFAASTIYMDFTTGTYRGANAGQLTVTRASSGYAETAGGALVNFASGVPRITDKGLLIEEARTNSITRSQELNLWSFFTNATIGVNADTAPDGTLTADRVFADAVNAGHNVQCPSFTSVAATVYTVSVYLKRGNMRYGYWQWTGGGTADSSLFLDFDTGLITFTSAAITNTSVQVLGNGWFRLSGIITAATGGGAAVRVGVSNSGISQTYAGTTADYVTAWGLQVEAGSHPTSYIPTGAVAVTRAEDSITLSGTAFTTPYGSPTALTFFTEYSDFDFSSTAGNIGIAAVAGPSTSYAGFWAWSGSPELPGTIRTFTRADNTTDANYGSVLPLYVIRRQSQPHRMAISISATVERSSGDGNTLAAGTQPTAFPSLTYLNFRGSEDLTSPAVRGRRYIRRVAVIPALRTNDELNILTSLDPTLDMEFTTGRYVGATPANLTVVRASTAYADNTAGVWTSFGANVARITDKGLLVEEGRTNSIRNNSMQGAVAGTPGTMPTNWTINGPAGLTFSVIGTGVDQGVDYVDLRITGTAGASGDVAIRPDGYASASAVAAVGQAWTGSIFIKLISNSGAAPTFTTVIDEFTGAGAYLTGAILAQSAPTTGNFQRYVQTRTMANASTGRTTFETRVQVTNGQTYDITLRYGWPQLELGAFVTSPIRTTSAAVVRANDQISLTGTSFTPWYINPSSYTLYGEVVFGEDTFAGVATLDLASDSANNQVQLLRTGATNMEDKVLAGSVLQKQTGTAMLASGITKVAFGIALNDMQCTVNGNGLFIDTACTVPTVDRLGVGLGAGLSSQTNGYVRRVAYYPSRMSSDRLLALTMINPTLDMDFAAGQYVGATPSSLTVTRASTGYAEDTSGNWTSFSSNQPRITNKGLLVEESRTNSIRNNSMQGATAGVLGSGGTLPTNWSHTGGVTAGLTCTIIGTGTENGVEYVDIRYNGTTSSTVFVPFFESSATNAASSGQVWTASAFVKLVSGSLTNVTSFVLDALSIGGSTTGSLTFTPGSTLTRVSAACTMGAGTTNVRPQISVTVTNAAAVDFTIRFGWPQLELGASATSPIRTTTAAVARAADAVSLAGGNFTSWFTGGSSGAMYAEVIPDLSQTNGFPGYFAVDDGTTNNFLQILMNNAGNNSSYEGTSGGVAQFGLGGTVLSAANNKFALAYATNDAAASTNGSAVSTDVSVTVPTGLTTARLGSLRAGSNIAAAYIRRVRYWPTRIANINLQGITA